MKLFAEMYVAFILLGWLAQALLFGVLAYKLADKKAYFRQYFWIGFFLGVIGLLYVGFLPMGDTAAYEKARLLDQDIQQQDEEEDALFVSQDAGEQIELDRQVKDATEPVKRRTTKKA